MSFFSGEYKLYTEGGAGVPLLGAEKTLVPSGEREGLEASGRACGANMFASLYAKISGVSLRIHRSTVFSAFCRTTTQQTPVK